MRIPLNWNLSHHIHGNGLGVGWSANMGISTPFSEMYLKYIAVLATDMEQNWAVYFKESLWQVFLLKYKPFLDFKRKREMVSQKKLIACFNLHFIRKLVVAPTMCQTAQQVSYLLCILTSIWCCESKWSSELLKNTGISMKFEFN